MTTTDGREVPLRFKVSKHCSTPFMSRRPDPTGERATPSQSQKEGALAFFEILADMAPRGRTVVDEVHQGHRGVACKNEIDPRFPWAYHTSQREG